ncbi:MAG: rRNA maturation RNase YbeY [Candidatus Neomarinimicrobiota bacterium]
MSQVSCQSDPSLDQPIHINAKQIVIDTFKSKNIVEYDISLVFASDEYLLDLKKKYFGKNHLTDVIAFRLNEYDNLFVEGEVYISLPRAKENSKIFNQPYEKEVSRLIIHGCLHLMGFKDESRSDKAIMTNNEEEILKMINWEGLFPG